MWRYLTAAPTFTSTEHMLVSSSSNVAELLVVSFLVAEGNPGSEKLSGFTGDTQRGPNVNCDLPDSKSQACPPAPPSSSPFCGPRGLGTTSQGPILP